jgi:hypothetical protein
MNERIKELAKVAEYWANTFEDKSRYQEYLMETFAELIVLECANKVFDIFDALPDVSVSDLQYYIRDRIKEHFGVEE